MKQNQIANYKDESQAYDGEFECFRLLNRSQFVTSSRISSLVNWNLYLPNPVATSRRRKRLIIWNQPKITLPLHQLFDSYVS